VLGEIDDDNSINYYLIEVYCQYNTLLDEELLAEITNNLD